MSTVLNARYISSTDDAEFPAVIEVVYDDKVLWPMIDINEGWDDVQAWVNAGNTIQPYNDGSETPITNTDDWIKQVRKS